MQDKSESMNREIGDRVREACRRAEDKLELQKAMKNLGIGDLESYVSGVSELMYEASVLERLETITQAMGGWQAVLTEYQREETHSRIQSYIIAQADSLRFIRKRTLHDSLDYDLRDTS